MTTMQQARRTGTRALTTGALAALLFVAAPVAASAAASHTAGAGSPAAAARVFTCAQVDADLPNLFARECNSDHWGPISDFDVVDRRTKARFHCETGWAEGNLWLQGQNCRKASTGS
ncbi:hypothetical protein ACFVT1_17705 [Streptomyces sp. NPDC057963]|uniref:hypothetical protein n=1 Tax=Streptomyces sp. NPDC057963 TaxID=3346290 RepID=UPI0036EAAB36